MSDLESYVPWSQRDQTPKPGDLLPDEQVQKILSMIPDLYRALLIRHMNESERSAYAQGVSAAPSKEEATPTTAHLSVLDGAGIGGYTRRKACLRWKDVIGLRAHLECNAEDGPTAACLVFVAGLDKPLIAAHSIDELMPAFLKANKP